MVAPASSTAASWELAVRLRSRREHLHLTADQVGTHLGVSRSYVSQVEKRHTIPAAEKLDDLARVLGFDDAERGELQALRSTARERGWWESYADLFGNETLDAFGLEYGASTVQAYEGALVTGLLQTTEYTRGLMASDMTLPQTDLSRRIRLRTQRQARLDPPDPLRLEVVMSEAALLQHVSDDPDVLAGQLTYLLTMIERHPDTIDIRIAPFRVNPGSVLGSSTFYLFKFASPQMPPLAWRESTISYSLVESPQKVHEFDLMFRQARAASLDPAASKARIERALDDATGAAPVRGAGG
ncbi:MAG: helix-turn-helix domain-containing protein [Acidimicrobiales bacterium]